MTADAPPAGCPHCGSRNVDPGATGLDSCNDCGGLSRDGRPLREAPRRLPQARLVSVGLNLAEKGGPTASLLMLVDVPEIDGDALCDDATVAVRDDMDRCAAAVKAALRPFLNNSTHIWVDPSPFALTVAEEPR